MTVDEAKAQYIAALRQIIASDTVIGPLLAERSALLAANVSATAEGMVSLNNRILNAAASDEALKAIKELRNLRVSL